MRDSAADLDFERAARLRDEIKRLQATELAIADDPLARDISDAEGGKRRGRSKAPANPRFGPRGEPLAPRGEAGGSLFRKNTLDEMTVGRTEKPVGGAAPAKPEGDARPIRRERIGAGSYEDPGDEKRRKRRPGKTGRPGQ